MKKISWNTFTKLSVGAYGCLLPPTPIPVTYSSLGPETQNAGKEQKGKVGKTMHRNVPTTT